MAAKTGRSVIAAYEPSASTWGTAVAPGALDGLIVKNLSPLKEPAEMHPEAAAGYQWHENIDKCRITTAPEVMMDLRWSNRQWSFIAQCLGLDTVSDTDTHTMTCIDAIDGSDNFGTLAAEVGGSLIHEWPSVKPVGFTIEGPNGEGYLDLTVRTIADCHLQGADATSAAGDFDAVTYMQIDSALSKKIPFGALRFRLNTDAGALDGDDDLNIKSFNLTFDRQLSQEWVNREALADAWKTAEPIEDGIPVCTFNFELGDYNAQTYIDMLQDETTFKAELYFQYTATENLTISIPSMKVVDSDVSVSGPNRMPQNIQGQMMKASSNPTGMSNTLLYMVLQDEQTAAYE